MDTSSSMAGFAEAESVDTSGVVAEYEVAPLSSTDLSLAGRDAPASPAAMRPQRGTTTSTLGDELPQSSIRAQRRIG